MKALSENFRQFLDRLRSGGHLIDMKQPVDIRHIATLVDQSDKALFFHNVIGYDMPVVSGIIRSRDRVIMSMGCTEYGQIEQRLRQGMSGFLPCRDAAIQHGHFGVSGPPQHPPQA